MSEVLNAGSVYAKVALVMGELKSVPKTGYNTHHNYHYVKGSDLADLVRPVMSKFGLALSLNCVAFESVPWKTSNGKECVQATVTMKYILGDETGATIESIVMGQAQDTGDKALYKAYAGAMKYYLIQAFSIGSEDDPELDGRQGNNNRGGQQGNRPQGNQPQGQRPNGNGPKGGGNNPSAQNEAPQGTPPAQNSPVRNQAQQGNPGAQQNQAQNQAPQGNLSVVPENPDTKPFIGRVKLKGEPVTQKKRTPTGMMDNITIDAVTGTGQKAIIEGWGVEMIEHLADLSIGQILVVDTDKARISSSGVLRIQVGANNFTVEGPSRGAA